MLPPELTKSIEHLTSVLVTSAVIGTVGVFVTMLLARSFGGKSSIWRQTIFSVGSFASICAAAYYAFTVISVR